mgnify:FL=1
MIITITIIASVVVFIVGYSFGAVNNTEPLQRCCLECLHTHKHGSLYPPFYGESVCCNHFGLDTLRSERDAARNEIRRLLYENENLKRMASDYRNKPMEQIWFKEVGDKEKAAAKLKEMLKPAKELEELLTP